MRRARGEALGQRQRLGHQRGRIDGARSRRRDVRLLQRGSRRRADRAPWPWPTPTSWVRKYVPPKSPERPTLAKAVVIFAPCAAMRKSQASAIERPAPAAAPGMDGDGDLRHVVQPARHFHALAQRMRGLLGRAAMVRAAFGRRKALNVAARAEGAAGAGDDDRRRHRICSEARQRFHCRAASIGCDRALRASGRFMVRMATPSSFVSRRSAMRVSLAVSCYVAGEG